MYKVTACELSKGNVLPIVNTRFECLYRVAKIGFYSIDSMRIILTLNPLLASGRWSKKTVDMFFDGGAQMTVADNKAEGLQLLESMKHKSDEDELPFFVYGTLRRDCGNYHYFEGRTVAECPATVKGDLWHTGSIIPYMTEGEGIVHGELMFVNPSDYTSILRRIDGLEGYSKGGNWNHYNRKRVAVALEDGSQVEAWAYYYANNRGYSFKQELYPINGGDYKRWTFHRELNWRKKPRV